MERFTKMFSLSFNLLAAVEGVVRLRTVCHSMDPPAGTDGRPEKAGLEPSAGGCTIHPRKKGGLHVGKTKCGKGTKIMVLADGNGLPITVQIHSASPNEVTLIEPLLDQLPLAKTPERLIYDMAADSDPLRDRLAARKIELICPHRYNRTKPARQDKRRLRRYRKRYKIERLNSWLQNFRRLVVRYEYHAQIFLGFVQLACLMIILRNQ